MCRKIIAKEKLIESLQTYLEMLKEENENTEKRCRFLTSLTINFLIEKLNIKFIDNESFYKFENLNYANIKVPHIFKQFIILSQKL